MVDWNLIRDASIQGGYHTGNSASRTPAMERRRRRFLMRRRAAANGGGRALGLAERVPRLWEQGRNGSSSAAVGYPASGGREEDIVIDVSSDDDEEEEKEDDVLIGNPVPVIGAIALRGRLRYMEDAICIKTGLCSPAINKYLPVHYFGAFDGHGGPHFSILCKQKMHEVLREELIGRPVQLQQRNTPAAAPPGVINDESVLKETWKNVMTSCFLRTETAAFQTCRCGSLGFRCGCDCIPETFSGTTALTVVLTEKHIITANCGDSRAVLYRRGGFMVSLSYDHKASRRCEIARIQATGGHVLLTDTHRVEGILAMTRAIGDEYLKPLVISEPEVTFNRRSAADEFIVLATDGLWDVMPTQTVGDVTIECLGEPRDLIPNNRRLPAEEEPCLRVSPSRSVSAAALLCRLALARNSTDNISVVVVDLRRLRSGDDHNGGTPGI